MILTWNRISVALQGRSLEIFVGRSLYKRQHEFVSIELQNDHHCSFLIDVPKEIDIFM